MWQFPVEEYQQCGKKAHFIDLLKVEKDPENLKSYRPVSLLCHLMKVYERLILGEIQDTAE